MLRIVLSIGIGILAGGAAVMVAGPPGAGSWTISVGLILTILPAVFLGIARQTRTIQSPTAEQIRAAGAAGRLGRARVDALAQTGTQINNQPLCDIDLTVQPVTGAAYRTRVRDIVQLTELARFAPGTEHTVAILADGQPDIAFAPAHDDGTQGVVVPAAGGELPLRVPPAGTLKADGTRQKPIISVNPRTRPLRIVLFVLIGALTAGAVAFPYRESVAQTLQAIPEGRLHADLRTPESLEGALDAVMAEAGVTSAFTVSITADYMSFELPVEDGSQRSDDWTYRRGEITHVGPSSIQPDDAREQFPIDDVAWDRLWPSLEEAAQQVGVEDVSESGFTIKRFVSEAEAGSDDFGTMTGPVEAVFTVEDAYESTTFTMNADGSELTAFSG
ncbi:hypothetical protein ACEK07_12555 [Alcanivoracaceae bacterium MT1]